MVVAAALVLLWQLKTIAGSLRRVESTDALTAVSQNAYREVAALEAHLNSHLLTGSPMSRSRYVVSRGSVEKSLEQLRASSRADRTLKNQVLKADRAWVEMSRFYDHLLSLKGREGRYLVLVRTGRGRHLNESVSQEFRTLIDRAVVDRSQAQLRAAVAMRWALMSVGVIVLGSLLGLLFPVGPKGAAGAVARRRAVKPEVVPEGRAAA